MCDNTIVVDNGSGMFKVGFAKDKAPRAINPLVIEYFQERMCNANDIFRVRLVNICSDDIEKVIS